MPMDYLGSDSIRDPLRSEIITRILYPREECLEYQKGSGYGTITPVFELGPKDRKGFATRLTKLLELGV